MTSFHIDDLLVQFDQDGGRHFKRSSMKNWLGKPIMISRAPYRFAFDLEGRIQQIDGFPSPHSWDWLQRTMTNDWIYYDRVWVTGDTLQPTDLIGESFWAVNGRTDLPMLQEHGGLQRDHVHDAQKALDEVLNEIRALLASRPGVETESGQAAPENDAARVWAFLEKAGRNGREQMAELAEQLHAIHGPMDVLPPDTLDVDYRVLLVKVMDGCPNTCRFCTVRGSSEFTLRDSQNIDAQIDALTKIYGDDLFNYNSVVFGECDALRSPLLEQAARRAFIAFRCGESFHEGSNLFLFSTNRTLLDQADSRFDLLDTLPFERIHINVGWEAATDTALARLGKAQTAQAVLQGLERAGRINRTHQKVGVSGNFILADDLEVASIIDALRRTHFHGPIFLSPLQGQCSAGKAINDLLAVRKACPETTVQLYTMQRM